tara:strand:+ start:396 stop:554 length:159 start_codon:yes stop_codon:yes gene_type:complete
MHRVPIGLRVVWLNAGYRILLRPFPWAVAWFVKEESASSFIERSGAKSHQLR